MQMFRGTSINDGKIQFVNLNEIKNIVIDGLQIVAILKEGQKIAVGEFHRNNKEANEKFFRTEFIEVFKKQIINL